MIQSWNLSFPTTKRRSYYVICLPSKLFLVITKLLLSGSVTSDDVENVLRILYLKQICLGPCDKCFRRKF